MLSNLLYNINRTHLFLKGDFLSRKEKYRNLNFPIDFVVTWVDENDPVWLAQKKQLLEKCGASVRSDNGTDRFRDWNLFHYWFRSVEKNAPWVRRVYLVTCGHIPSWLNTYSKKLVVVKHDEFIPKKYLPTFSSIPIELNLHRIQDLSEHFVYFNDDMFLAAPITPEDFFQDSMPKCCAIAFPLKNDYNNDSFKHQLFSNLGVFNGFWKGKISHSIKNYPEKWFSKKYGGLRKYNISVFDSSYLPGMYFSHLGVPFCKSTFNQVWNDIPEKLDDTCSHRFRTPRDINHQIVTLWDIISGNFCPIEPNYYGKVFSIFPHQIQSISDSFTSHTNKMICLNDTYLITEDEFLTLKESIGAILQSAFPEKSSFEK